MQRLGKLFEEQRTVNPSTEFRRRVDLHNKIMGLLNEMMDLEAKIMDTQNSLNNMENEELRKD